MKRLSALLLAIIAALLLTGCGNKGDPAPAPADVRVVPGDGSATVSWTMAPGVEYWMFAAVANSVTPQNCNSLTLCRTILNATSPLVVSGLINGTTYSFTVNGRTGGGPGGPGSIPVSTVPRLAGASWTVGTSIGSNDLRGVTYGAAVVAVGVVVPVGVVVAVGTQGAMFSSSDGGITWTALTSGVSSDLNAAVYGGIYMAAGAGGAMLSSSDAITWTSLNSATPNNIYALTTNGGGVYLAAGANGTIIYTTDRVNWVAANSGTANDLRGMTYGNGRYVAVGAQGTLLTSTDAVTWQAVAGQSSSDLIGVAYGLLSPTSTSLTSTSQFVAIGADGTLTTSTDGVTWTPQPPIATTNPLAAVAYGTQFVAVGANGSIITSTDGVNWQAQTSGTSNNLNAVTRNLYGYSVVGNAGVNLTAF
jgi:predicted small lipoprotein YifL